MRRIKQYMKPNVLLPIFIGTALVSILYVDRIFDDIPGLPIIMLILSFASIYCGVRNINRINKDSKLVVVVPMLMGAAGAIWSSMLFLNGEFREFPGFFAVRLALYAGWFFIGLFNIKKIRQKIDPAVAVPAFYSLCGVILAVGSEFDGDVTVAQRILIAAVLLFVGFLSMGAIMLARKLMNVYKNRKKRNSNRKKRDRA
ncbi:MAG: hypothetical protein LBD35_07785 [Prevotellaceae bacterium]|jgi:membrane protein implicated in regulation of membrane protease activity|nr:hypothetical protein [Prevotellaceae bacterium]